MRVVAPLLVVALLAPLAAAHTAVTVHAPTAPLAPFKTTGIDVDVAAECADTFLGVPPSSSADRDLALSEATPKGLAWSGETVTVTAASCVAGGGDAEGSGTLLVTPDGTIPAFSDLALEVVCESCEGGAFTAQVGYYANLTAVPVSDARTGTPFDLVLNVSTNFDTDLRFSVATAGAKATLSTVPAEVLAKSPLLDGRTSRPVTVSLQASGPAAGWSTDEVTLKVEASPHGKAGNATSILVKLPIANGSAGPGPSATSSSTKTGTSSGGSKDSPAPPAILALALVAIAVALRRR